MPASKHSAIVTDPQPGWASPLLDALVPGAHAIVSGRWAHGIEARRAGFEIRDTVLVPGHATILLLRKPYERLTVATQIADTGTGALWIDGCRIGTPETITNHARSAEAAKSKGCYNSSRAQGTHQTSGQQTGRWPTNLLLLHRDGCRQTGNGRSRGPTTRPACGARPPPRTASTPTVGTGIPRKSVGTTRRPTARRPSPPGTASPGASCPCSTRRAGTVCRPVT